MTQTTPIPTTFPEAATGAARAARHFGVATLLFIGLVVTMAVGLSERQTAQADLASELGVGLDEIPAGQLADVIRETWNTPAVLLIGALALLSTAVYSRGMLALGGVAAHHRPTLVRVTVVLPLVGAVAFLGLLGIERALTSEPGWLVENWWVSSVLLAIFVLTVTLALVVAVLRIWPTGAARRTSVVVLVLAVVLAFLSVTAGAPPVLPLVLAVVYAVNVRRSARVRS